MNESRPQPPFPAQSQPIPGHTRKMNPAPDHGEASYRGSGKLAGKAAIITGGDSGIGRAVAIAFAREGADVLVAYLSEDDDARETARWIEKAGRKCVLVKGDVAEESHCGTIVEQAEAAFGRIDILVNNAAYQMVHDDLDAITGDELDRTFRTNIYAMFHLARFAVPHMPPGGAIVNTASINADKPNPALLAYAATKGAIANFTSGLAQLLAGKGIRVNAVAPGPIWTPLIPASFPEEKVESFGRSGPMKRPGQPAEVAPVFVLLASPEASYVSGAVVPVTGGAPML